MPGESLHEVGRDGAIRAKRWLEATTRVDVPWVNPDHVAKLSFPWIGKGTFSFDLGGTLRGGDVHGQEFFAEVKRYTNASDQGSLYREYLAKCYCAYQCSPARCDHFMWITWHPFSVTRWTRLCTAKEVEDAVRGEKERALGLAALDEAVCQEIADRLWLIVLSDRQENLVIEEPDLDAAIASQRQRAKKP